jgi:hypothetical protein
MGECGRLGCCKLRQLRRAEYEGIRKNPRGFAILDGHEILDAEEIAERPERYLVVEKAGDPEAEVVEHTDPRRPLDKGAPTRRESRSRPQPHGGTPAGR